MGAVLVLGGLGVATLALLNQQRNAVAAPEEIPSPTAAMVDVTPPDLAHVGLSCSDCEPGALSAPAPGPAPAPVRRAGPIARRSPIRAPGRRNVAPYMHGLRFTTSAL
jgi:hypothetical protein